RNQPPARERSRSPSCLPNAGPVTPQDLKYQVSVWAMWGLSLTALFQRRSGTLPRVFLTTRTPWEAGEFDTTGISQSSSRAIFQTSLPMRMRSSSLTPNDLRYLSITSRMRGGGVLPLTPALAYQIP